MERTEVLDMMSSLKLYGMRSAYDETLATAIKRKHEPQRLVGDLLKAEISEKQARSIKYQLTVAKLPLAKDVEDFAFKDTPINEALVRDLAGGAFIAQQRNVVLVGGTGTGKTHLAIAIARSCIRSGSRGRFFTTVDLVNQLEAEGRAGRQGRIADYLPARLDVAHPRRTRLSPRSPKPAANCYSISSAGSTNAPPRSSSSTNSRLRRMAERVRRPKDDHRTPRSVSPTIATSSRPAMRVGASRTAPDLTITAPHRPALAPPAHPRPASPRRALPSARVSKRVPIPCKSGVPVQCSLTVGSATVPSP